MKSLPFIICAVTLGSSVAAAQRIQSGGSFVATAAGATVGAAAGLSLGILLAPHSQGICALTVGGGCTTELDESSIAFIFGTTVVGTTAGAIIARRLTGGQQSVVHSVLGATVGVLAGGWIASQLRPEAPLPFGVAITIPTGLFATLAGW